ncbi:MAG: DUF348 domain-containing protein, partial [Anaerolineaceae bacterium]|nr:DUF348 domain-containing protein [Anaerolineaceae bacterium]
MKKFALPAGTALVLLSLILLLLYLFNRPVSILIDGVESHSLKTQTRKVESILANAGVPLGEFDRVAPALDEKVDSTRLIQIQRAYPVLVSHPGLPEPIQLVTAEKLPATILALAGIPFNVGDQILWNSHIVAPDEALPASASYVLQVRPVSTFTVTLEGETLSLSTQADSLAEALWQAGIKLRTSDLVSSDLSLHPADQNLIIRRSIPVTVQAGTKTLNSRAPATTVGDALNAAGVPLQGIDRSSPGEDSIPQENESITWLHVHEEVSLEQTSLPFEREYVSDPETELDQRSIVESGAYGLQVSRYRTLYEEGQEVSRELEMEWTAAEPQIEKVGFGTQTVVRSVDTPSGAIEYYRAVEVYATSYSPC